jgi:hypothetical protein
MRTFLIACLMGAVLLGLQPETATAMPPACFDYHQPEILRSSVTSVGGAGAFQLGNSIYQVSPSGVINVVNIANPDQPVVVNSGSLGHNAFLTSCQMRQVADYLMVFWSGYDAGWTMGSWMTVLQLSTLTPVREIPLPAGLNSITGCDMRLRYVYLARGSAGLTIVNVTSDNVQAWSAFTPGGRFSVGAVADVAFLGVYAYTVSGVSTDIKRIDATNPALPGSVTTYPGSVTNARVIARFNDKLAVFGDNRAGLYLMGGLGQAPELSAVNLPSAIVAGTRVGNAFFALASDGGRVHKVDMTVPAAIEACGYIELESPSDLQSPRIFTAGSNVVVGRHNGLDVYDTNQFVGIEHLYSSTYMGGDWSQSKSIEIDGQYAYVALAQSDASTGWLRTFDCSTVTNPVQLSDFEFPWHQVDAGNEFLAVGDYLYFNGTPGGVVVYDVSDKSAPVLAATIAVPNTVTGAKGLTAIGRFVYFSAAIYSSSPPYANSKIFVLDVSNPGAPFLVHTGSYYYPALDNKVVDVVADTDRGVLYAITQRGIDVYTVDTGTGALSLVAHANAIVTSKLVTAVLGNGDLYLTSDPTFGNDQVFFVDTENLSTMVLVEITPENQGQNYGLAFGSELYLTGGGEMDIYVPDLGWIDAHYQPVPYIAGTNTPQSIAAGDDMIAYLEGRYLVTAPRLCALPQTILPGSLRGEAAGEVLDDFHWRFTWRTVGYSDPALDSVTVTDVPGAPSGCQVGTVVLDSGVSGVSASVAPDGGTYIHTLTWTGTACNAGCVYQFSAASDGYESGTSSFAVGECPPDIEIEGKSARGEESMRFGAAAPNPFNPTTRLNYYVPNGARDVSLSILDAQGRRVRHLVEGDTASGWRSVQWDGADDQGRRAASGIYFARLGVDGSTVVQKLVMLK